MIYIFRKEMKRWYSVLWVVFISLGLSGLGFFFMRTKNMQGVAVAHVNGSPITLQEFKRARQDIQEQINRFSPFAQMYGMNLDTLMMTFFGETNPDQIAMDLCVRRELVDIVGEKFDVYLNQDYLKRELIKSLPPQFLDEHGAINMEVYRSSLERMHMTPAEYERLKAKDIKREMIEKFIRMSGYVPKYVLDDTVNSEQAQKAFTVVTFTLDPFIKQAEKNPVSDKDLGVFYEKNKETYRVGEKARALCWHITPEIYGQAIVIDSATVEAFYEKNKETSFRIPPQAKVRHIFIKGTNEASSKKAQEVYQEVLKNPSLFADLAKRYSQDVKTASKGGLIESVTPGSYNKNFEKVVFRLQEPLEISAVTETKEGYEIIQLIERTKASSKPLDSVRDEIVKIIKAKRSYNALRSDLEILIRSAKNDPTVLDRFIQKYGLGSKKTEPFTEGDTSYTPNSLEGLLTQQLFSKKKDSPIGYFVYEKEFVIYKKIDAEKSYIPSLQDIKQKVAQNYYKQQGEELCAKELLQAKRDLLEKKTSLQDIAKMYEGKIVNIPLRKKTHRIKELGHSPLQGDTLFLLSDTNQVLKIVTPQLIVLAQCTEIVSSKNEASAKSLDSVGKKEKNMAESMNLAAFIASLNRNAKIEIDSRIMQRTPRELE